MLASSLGSSMSDDSGNCKDTCGLALTVVVLVAVDSAAEPTKNMLIPAKAVEWGKLPHVLAACAVLEALWFNTNDEDPTVTVQYMYELSTLSICTCVPGVYNRYMYANCGCMGVPACGFVFDAFDNYVHSHY